jgi:hypothetical protein
VHDEKRSGCPSFVTDDLKGNVNAKIRENMRFTISNYKNLVVAGQSLRSDHKTKDMLCRTWRRPFVTKAYKSWSHDVTCVLIYMATV